MNKTLEIRCKNKGCKRLLMNYYVIGCNTPLEFSGVELKCEKCKRVFRMKKYTEDILIEYSKNGVFYM